MVDQPSHPPETAADELMLCAEFMTIVTGAFHRNWIGLIEAIPRYYPRARCWREDGVLMGYTGWSSATFNAAIIEDNRVLTPQRIRRINEFFEPMDVPHTIQIASDTATPGVELMLWNAGYGEIITDPMMTYTGEYAPMPLNNAVTVYQAVSEAHIQLYYDLVAGGFELPPIIEGFVSVMLRMKECTHLIAYLRGEPVGAGSLVATSGVAGVYNVTTLPAARHQGVATVIMHAIQRRALDMGYSGTALASSEMGVPLYHRLGYRADGYQIVYARLDG